MEAINEFYTIETASKALRKPRNTISRWLRDGRFPNSMASGRVKVIPRDDVESVRQEEADRLVTELAALGYNCKLEPIEKVT